MTDAAKIKALKNALKNLLNAVPMGWPMPVGWTRTAEQAENILKEMK